MMHTPSLPTELWQDIASYLEQKDQLPLLLLNRSSQAIYSPVLYRRLIIKGPEERIGDIPENLTREESQSKFILAGPATSRLLERLESSEETRGWVRHCQIASFKSQIPWTSWNEDLDQTFHAFQNLVWNIFTLVGSFPSLKSVELLKAEMSAESLYYICSRPHLSLSIAIVGVAFFGTNEVEPGTPFTVVRFKSEVSQLRHVMASFITLTLGCSLRELALGTEAEMHLRRFYQAHMDYAEVSLPRLELLTISWILTEYLRFFRATPNLIELRLRGMVKMALGNGPLDPSLLPKLQRFHGHNCFVPFFVTGRPVHTIDTRSSTGSGHALFLGQEDNIALSNTVPRFGSTVDVRNLVWDNCNSNRSVLQYLVDCNPKINCLELIPTLPYAKVELRARLEVIKELKELHTLYIRCLEHVPSESTLSWEREQCEWLQNKGSNSLISISFSTLIDWNREVGCSHWIPSGSGMPVYELDKAGAIHWRGLSVQKHRVISLSRKGLMQI